jgi:Tol biopolymer transport system component
MNGDGSQQTDLMQSAAEDCLPAWSPDGQSIAPPSARECDVGDIFLMPADASQPPGRIGTAPPWTSPTGSLKLG